MIRLKEGVCFNGVQPETVLAIMVAQSVFEREGQPCTLTSVCDGVHSSGSLHYVGLAFDIRTWADNKGTQLADDIKQRLASALRKELGKNFDIVVESTHIHV